MTKTIPWNKGKKGIYSKEAIQKMSEAHKGLKTGFQKGHPFYQGGEKGWFKKGRKSIMTDEIKKKISKANKGKIRTKETKERLRRLRLGKKLSQETKEKMSLTLRGKPKPWLVGRKHSEEHKEKIRQAMKGRLITPNNCFKKGEKHPSWNNGSSFEPYSTDWTNTLKRSIRERDHYICQLCLKDGYPVHHLDYNKKNCNPNNLITLCVSCNSKVNFNRNHWTNYFKDLLNLKYAQPKPSKS